MGGVRFQVFKHLKPRRLVNNQQAQRNQTRQCANFHAQRCSPGRCSGVVSLLASSTPVPASPSAHAPSPSGPAAALLDSRGEQLTEWTSQVLLQLLLQLHAASSAQLLTSPRYPQGVCGGSSSCSLGVPSAHSSAAGGCTLGRAAAGDVLLQLPPLLLDWGPVPFLRRDDAVRGRDPALGSGPFLLRLLAGS